MKKIFAALSLVFILCTVSHTQYMTMSVGVMPFVTQDKKDSRRDIISSGLTSALSRYNFLKLVERAKMSKLIAEVEMGMSGLFDEKTAVKQAKIHGVEIMVFGAVQGDIISARSVHVETGRILSAYSIQNIKDIEILAGRLASGIETHLAKENIKRLRNDSPDITLDFRVECGGTKITEGGRLKIGQSAIFHFRANRDGYTTIVDIQPGGDVVILFPNEMSPDNRVKAGVEYTIPSKEDKFEIKVTEPEGIDTIAVFFTEKKAAWLNPKKLSGQGFWTVKENEKAEMARKFAVVATELKKSQWESKVIEVGVVK